MYVFSSSAGVTHLPARLGKFDSVGSGGGDPFCNADVL